MKFDKLKDYIALTNSFKIQLKTIEPLQTAIIKLLSKRSGDLVFYVSVLSDKTKKDLTTALILGDGLKVKAELEKSGLAKTILKEVNRLFASKFSPDDLTRLVEHNSLSDTHYLNPVVKSIIEAILSQFLTQGRRTEFLKTILKSCHDSQLGIKAKKTILNEIDPKAAAAITDLAYEEFSPSLVSDFKAKIDLNKIQKVLSLTLDHSQFIILIRGIIRSLDDKDALKKLDMLYLNLNYQECVKFISEYVASHDFPLKTEILESSKKLVTTKLDENHNRRYFETKLSQYHFGTLGVIEIKAINKITTYLSDKFKVGFTLTDSKNMAQVEALLLSVTDADHALNRFERYKEWSLSRNSTQYKAKGRKYKSDVMTRRDMAVQKDGSEQKIYESHKIFSRQLGIMKAQSPYYLDELTEQNVMNRSVDIHDYSKKISDWPLSHPEIPYVGSLSGHTYFIVCLLNHYMSDNRADPNLSRDINIFLNSIIAAYIKQGFHSLYELIAVLQENHVQAVFKDYRVDLNVPNFNEKIIANAMEYATQYTLDHGYKQILHSDLLQSGLKLKPITQSSGDKKDEDSPTLPPPSPSSTPSSLESVSALITQVTKSGVAGTGGLSISETPPKDPPKVGIRG